MGQTLTNGIYLPNEGERNCYSGLAANWNAVDTLKGNYSLHAINVDIHVTAAEKETWNGKADNSALTAHTGDTTIHVTAADKQAWNGHVADSVKHVTAEDKNKWDAVTSKANDSDVVHKSGNETITGTKTFTGVNEILRTGGDHKLKIIDTRVTPLDPTGIITSNIIWQDSTGRLLGTVANDYDNSGNSIMRLYARSFNANDEYESHRLRLVSNKGGNSYADVDVNFLPSSNNKISLGDSTHKWSDVITYKVNGVEPSSLSLPSDINSRIDISSYFTNTGTGQSNSYTVPANGYIYLTLSELTNIHCFSRTSGNVINYAQTFTKPNNSTGALYVLFPVRKNDVFVATWYTTTTVSVDGAFFIPCKGNI